ncbi:hypothetical protein AXI76_gp219 [Pseudoalteromonas phage H101]|uniref:Uncharacterized protein n=1 Tax=Pseudoalteromonas phage H101 TaxID=1654919 RepID=A0A0H4J2E4_9CAUD|nr:hypothetical protein AXI76_gp219 [Pseudoalteromonas phage H101]AKO61120.1 hypothetical protein [Pseudoalteromonas phage H101]
MSNEVTKEMLDESLASIQDYLDNTSAEQFEKDYLEIRKFTKGGVPAAEIIGWEPEVLQVDYSNSARNIPDNEGTLEIEWGCPLDKRGDM